MLRKFPSTLLLFLLATAVSVAAEIKVATLNCYLLFDPRIEHRGKLDEQQRMSVAQYNEKLSNLASLIRGYDVVGIQETGGRAEVDALAAKAGMQGLWIKGNDTATGEEVGLLYKLPDWTVNSASRTPELDRILSKHLLVEMQNGDHRALFLVIHLIRPIGNQLAKHRQQLEAIKTWMRYQHASHPGWLIVVLGDTNSTLVERGSSLFGFGVEAGESVDFKPTHLNRSVYDRMVLLGPGTWHNVEIKAPPYDNRPPAALKRVWTDHFRLGGEIVLNPSFRREH
ncbi:MAG: hypothetical protein WCG63_00265 [Opitutaceae bacterium]